MQDKAQVEMQSDRDAKERQVWGERNEMELNREKK